MSQGAQRDPDLALGLVLLIGKDLFLLLRPVSWAVLSLHSHPDVAEDKPTPGESGAERRRRNIS